MAGMKRLTGLWFICVLLLTGCSAPAVSNAAPAPAADTITLTFIGDIVAHMPVINAARDSAGYDFTPMFADIRDEIAAADIATVVFETPLSDSRTPYSGYPIFNTPRTLADDMLRLGFDVAFTATNHALDKGEAGIRRTAGYLERIGLAQAGLRIAADSPPFVLKRANNITVAFLAYTTLTNGFPLPAGKPWMVGIYSERAARADIAAARAAGADAVVVALHTGTEYVRTPTAQQQAEVGQLAAAGADIILGSHIHVAQACETRIVTDSSGRQRSVFIAWSLGNSLSNQQWRYSDYGLLATLELARARGDSAVTMAVREVAPLWVLRAGDTGHWQYHMLKLDDDRDALAMPGLSDAARARLRAVRSEFAGLQAAWDARGRALLPPTRAAQEDTAARRVARPVAVAGNRDSGPARSQAAPERAAAPLRRSTGDTVAGRVAPAVSDHGDSPGR